MSASEFENALVDVRKAYRLIFLYQQRVLDLVKFIGDSLLFRFESGWPWYGDDAWTSGTRVSLDSSGWEWLHFYFYEFYFKALPVNGDTIQFSVLAQADTGYFDTNANDYLNVNSFEPVETSSTKLIFMIGKNCWHNDFKKEFDDNANSMYKKNFIEDIKYTDKGILILKAFPLSRFINIDEAKACLQEWVSFCNEKGISEIKLKPGLMSN